MPSGEDKSDPPYQAQFPVDVRVGDKHLRVTVHFAAVDGQISCVGLDIRSFTSPAGFEPPEDRSRVVPIGGEWTTITSPLVRGVRVAAVIEKAIEGADSWAREGTAWLADGGYSVTDLVGLPWSPVRDAPKRRGPKPLLDDALLRDVVARAYRSAPTKPVQAVRHAMAREIPVYKGNVTADVARKAVVAARARGFIHPAKRSSKRQDGSSR